MDTYSSFADEQLVALLRDSEEAAFAEIYGRYWDRLYSVAYHRMSSEVEAEEIVQDIFVSLWQRRKNIYLTNSLSTYLAVAVKYQVITRLAQMRRKKDVEGAIRLSSPEGVNTTAAWLSEKELREQLEQCIQQLPEKCRIVFTMSRERSMSNAEIAEELNISEKTVEGHITKALSSLRSSLKISLPLLLILLQK